MSAVASHTSRCLALALALGAVGCGGDPPGVDGSSSGPAGAGMQEPAPVPDGTVEVAASLMPSAAVRVRAMFTIDGERVPGVRDLQGAEMTRFRVPLPRGARELLVELTAQGEGQLSLATGRGYLVINGKAQLLNLSMAPIARWGQDGAPPDASLQGLWAGSGSDVWACGWGVLMHHDGQTWAEDRSISDRMLYGVWGLSSRQVWSVGERGTVLFYNGSGWTRQSIGAESSDVTLRRVWGSSAHDVWAVGHKGAILRFDGLSWRKAAFSTSASLYALWGVGYNDVWIGGEDGTLVHWNGSSYAVAPKVTSDTVKAMWGKSADNIWAVGLRGTLLHYDGARWTVEDSPAPEASLLGVGGAGIDDVWVVGEGGVMLHYNGTFWARRPSDTTATLTDVVDLGVKGMVTVGVQSIRRLR